MKSLFNQGALIYTLEKTNSMGCFDQTDGHDLPIIQFSKSGFLAGHSLVIFQAILHSMNLSIHFYSDKPTV